MEELIVRLFKLQQERMTDGERPGQALFNALDSIDPVLALKIAGGDADCFYIDARMGDFLNIVLDAWEQE